ncbi:hypothetical protein JXI42_03990 [bacterium]|nr:hypothetical protein [bacterium]
MRISISRMVIFVFSISLLFLMLGCGEDEPVDVEYIPSINTLTATPFVVSPGDTATVAVEVSYAGSDQLTYTWSADEGTVDGEGTEIIWIAPAEMGTYMIECEVADDNNAVTGKVYVHVASAALEVPIINSLTATSFTVSPNGTTTVMASITYGGELSLTYEWNVSDGVIIGDSSVVQWVAPDEEGVYRIEFIISNDMYYSMGELYIHVTSTGLPPDIVLSGEVTDNFGDPLDNVNVFIDEESHCRTSSSGDYFLSTSEVPVNLTFYKSGYTGMTFYGLEHGHSPELRPLCVQPFYSTVTVKAYGFLGFHPVSNIYMQAFSSNMLKSDVIIVPPDSLTPFDTLEFTIEGVPADTIHHFYVIACNTEQTLCSVADEIFVTGDTTVYLGCYVRKVEEIEINIGTFPTGLVDFYRIAAWVDSTHVDTNRTELLKSGKIMVSNIRNIVDNLLPSVNPYTLNFAEPFVFNFQSNLDSTIEVRFRRYNITIEAVDVNSNVVGRIFEDVPLNTEYLEMNFMQEFPEVELDSISGDSRPFFSWRGNADLYMLEIREEGVGGSNSPVWIGITQGNKISFPKCPEGVSILSSGPYYYRLRSFIIPGFDINDNPDLDNLLESAFTSEHEFGFGRRLPASGSQRFTITK